MDKVLEHADPELTSTIDVSKSKVDAIANVMSNNKKEDVVEYIHKDDELVTNVLKNADREMLLAAVLADKSLEKLVLDSSP